MEISKNEVNVSFEDISETSLELPEETSSFPAVRSDTQ